MSAKSDRAKARAKLTKKFWGNAYMGTSNEPAIGFKSYQVARKEAWEHGMKVGFAAGLRFGSNGVAK